MPEPNDDPQSPDEYPLSPDEPLPQVEDSMPAQPIDSAERPIDAETNQFSLGELLGLVTVMAVLLSVIGSVARWTSLGKSPATLAAVYATVLGLVAVGEHDCPLLAAPGKADRRGGLVGAVGVVYHHSDRCSFGFQVRCSMSANQRLSTGIEGLDERLGGGLLPGTLTVVVGSTGIGKTQFGLQFARAGLEQEGQPGVVFDMTARGDSQNHADYARRMFGWELATGDPEAHVDLSDFFADRHREECLHIFNSRGRRVTRQDMDFEAWHDWQAELARRLNTTIAFFYGNFVRGVRRAVVDGIEPVDRPSDSVQIDLFEYIYHQILRKDAEWVARDLFREHYRENAAAVAAHAYDPQVDRLHAALHVARNDARRPDRAVAGRRRSAGQRQHDHPPRQDPRRDALPPGDVREQTPRQPLPRRDHSLYDRRPGHTNGIREDRSQRTGQACLWHLTPTFDL